MAKNKVAILYTRHYVNKGYTNGSNGKTFPALLKYGSIKFDNFGSIYLELQIFQIKSSMIKGLKKKKKKKKIYNLKYNNTSKWEMKIEAIPYNWKKYLID